MLVLPNNIERLKMKPGQFLGSTSNIPLVGYSCAPNPYSIPCTVIHQTQFPEVSLRVYSNNKLIHPKTSSLIY